MNLSEIFGVVSVQYRAVLGPIFMEITLLVGGRNSDSARKVRILRKTTRLVGPTSLYGVKGMPTVCLLEKLHQGWFPHSGRTPTNWENQP